MKKALRLLFSALIFCSCLLPTFSFAQYTKLLDFADASTPFGSNTQGSLFSDGTYLYGMPYSGGTNHDGLVFKIKPDGTGYADLLDFLGAANGKYPDYGSLVSDGTYLYGTTFYGGTNNMGGIFKIKPDGTGYVKLLDFAGTTNGSYPSSSLFFDGVFLYGMTSQGGTNSDGVIFKIKTDGTGYTKLLDFAGTSNGSGPYGSLISDGTFLYGMTTYGGTNNYGVIFKIMPDGTGYLKILDFAGTSNGSNPYGTLISDGTYLYGTTYQGGANNMGVVFKIKTDGTGYADLLDFSGTANGKWSECTLISDGTYLYGTTYQGGSNNMGVIFKIKTDGTGYADLLDFSGSSNGSYAIGSLISDGSYLYGMTSGGGANGFGVAFKYCLQPVINVSANPSTPLCGGNSATLTAGGGVSYVWSPGGQTTSSIVVTPTTATTYTVTGTNTGGCSNTATVTVSIGGVSQKISFNKACINLGNVGVGNSVKDSVYVTNIGCSPLIFTGEVSTPSAFTNPVINGTMPPGQSGYLPVTFTPTAIGSYSGNVTFHTNDNITDSTVCLTGTGVPPPTVSVTPTSYSVSVACGDSTTQTLTINNTGGANLTWNLTSSSGINNGGFETGSFSPWTVYETLPAPFIAPNPHSGSFSAFLGSPNGGETPGNSSIYLTITVPSNGGTLSYWYYPTSQDGIAYDWQDAYITNTSGGILATVMHVCSNTQIWTNVSYDLASFAGQTIRVEFLVHGDNAGDWTNMYVDDVSVNFSSLFIPTPASGTTAPSTYDPVTLKFKSTNLNAGTYYDTLLVSSNDPATPIVKIPCTFTVVGSPKIVFNKTCINYDSVFVNVTAIDSVLISNTGCDTLHVLSAVASPSVFAVLPPTSGNLPPGDSGYVKITFVPSAASTYSGNVTFHSSNANDTTICLTGTGIPPPVISTVPTSLSYTLACCDSITTGLTIHNTGGSNLISQISGGTRKIKVALVNADAGYVSEVQTKLIGTGKFTTVDIINAETSTPTLVQLKAYDAVLVWSNNIFNDVTTLGNNLADYVDAGGGVVMAVFADASQPIGGRFGSGNAYYCINPSGQTNTAVSLGTIFVPSHPILKGVTSVSGTSLYHESSTAINSLATRIANWSDGTPLVATRVINGTNRVDLGMWPPSNDSYGGQWLPSTDGALLMANALVYSANASVSWMTINPNADTITAGGSAIVNVKLKSCGLSAGTYTTNITIASNDPVTPIDTIPATLYVVGSPKIVFNKSCINYGSLFVNGTATDSVLISNTGCDTLHVLSATASPSVFTVLPPTSGNLPPGDSGYIKVTFVPSAVTSYSGTVTFHSSNANDTTICLTGTGIPPPVISTLPTSLSYTLACCDSIRKGIAVHNTGGNPLVWTATGAGSSSGSAPSGYCNPTMYPSNGYSYINSVTTSGGFTNITTPVDAGFTSNAASGVNYFPSSIVSQSPGGTYTLTVQAQGSGNIALFSVWVDWNRNGVFDSGELMVNNVGTGNALTNFTINVPLSAVIGVTRMRIIDWTYGNPPAVCGDLSGWYGETEDYNVNVGSLGFSMTNTSGTTAASGVDSIIVKFKSCGLAVGTYTTNITIASNDPVKPIDTVPATLQVIGAGKIALTKTCLYMDSIMQYTSHTDSLYIKNTGCDTLRITNISNNTSTYSVSANTFNIPTGDSARLKVTFNPQTYPGPFLDTLYIRNNDITDSLVKVCLSGKSFQAPIISTVPTSFSYTLACCDSATASLTIHNTGGSNLLNQITGGVRKIKVAIVAAESGAPSYETDVQTKLMSTGKFTAVDIIDATSFTPTLLQLQGYDAVLTWNHYSYNNPTSLGNVLADYVDAGGGVVTAIFTTGNYNRIAGRFDSQNYWAINPTNYGISSVSLGTISQPNHPIMKNITSLSGGGYHVISNSIMSGASIIAYWSDGNPLVVTKNINGHNRVDLGMWPPSDDVTGGGNSWSSSTDGALLMANALAYSTNASVTWMSITPKADTISSSSSSIVNIKFKSCGLTVGTYTTDITIASNDPLKPIDTIPATLQVVGAPEIVFNKTCINYGSQFVNTTIQDSVMVTNTGCDTLRISSIVVTPNFTITPTSGNLPPGDSGYVKVIFGPLAVQSYTGTITFHSNDHVSDSILCLTGAGIPPPVECHSPNSFNVHFTICQDSITDTLSVCNTLGGSNLNYNLWSPYGRSASFNGSNANISIGTSSLFNFAGAFTVEAWIKVGLFDKQWQAIITKGDDSWRIHRYSNSNNIGFSTSGLSNVDMQGSANVNDAKWHHIAAVYNGSLKLLYIDGQLDASTSVSGTLNTSSYSVLIGENAESTGRYFNGKMDEVRIYNRALSQSEILANMTNTLTGNESGLKGYWNFDNGTANDLTANGNNGTLGTTTITVPNVQFIPSATGTVTPTNTYTIQVKFKKVGLSFGAHNIPLYLNSNDPTNPSDTISVAMIIDSLPPSPPVARDTSVCFGSPTPPLTAHGNAGDTIKWYSNASLTTLVSQGNIFNTGQTAVGTYTYYVTATDSISGCRSQSDTVHLHINTAPGKPTVANKASCFGQTTPILTSTGTIPLWFSNGTLTNLVHTGSSYNTGLTVAGTYTYYVVDSTGGCPKSPADTATLTIHALPQKPIAHDTAACFGGTIPSILATTTGRDTVKWYNSALSYLYTGNPYATGQTAAGTYTYYVTQNDTVTGCTSPRDTALLTINSTPMPTASNVNVCFGNSANVTATGTNIQWYSDSLITSVGTGSAFNTGQTAVGTYTYYVTQTLNGCQSPAKKITLTINPIPSVPVAPDASSCFGQTTPPLTATGTNVSWYSNASLSVLVHSGSPYNTGLTAAGSYTYYITQSSAGCASSSDTVYLTIHALPSRPIAANVVVCFGNPTPDMVATGISGSDIVKWYASSSLTPSIYTGNPYTSGQTAVGTYTYYVTQTDTVTGCRSQSDTATLAINSAPGKPTANDVTICFGGSSVLTSTGNIPQWFNNPALAPVVHTGSPYNTGITAVGSYTFFVTDSIAGCPQSPADTSVLTINPIPSAPVSVPQKDSICFGSPNTSFSATGTNIQWWTDAATTNLIASGSPLTPTVTAVGTYTAFVTQTSLGCKSPSDTAIFKINAVPVVNLGADVTQCGGSVTLNAGNSGASYLWSDASTNQTLVVSSTGTYSVVVTNSGGCTMSDIINITINPIPSAPVSSPQSDSICFGSPNPSFSASGTNIQWWTDAATTNLIASGSPLTPTVTAAGSYIAYVTQTVNGCMSPSDTAIFKINLTPKLSVSNKNIPFTGQTDSLFAYGTNVQWYDNALVLVNSGDTFPTGQSVVGTYTYYVTQTMNGCESAKDTVVLTIVPGAPLAVNDTVCFGQPVPNLTATGTNLKWYSDAALTNLVYSGNPFATGQTAAGTYTYYVTQTVNNVQSPDTIVTLTINPLPGAPPAAGILSACFGSAIPDLTATGTNLQWYDNTSTVIFTGNPFATGQTAAGVYSYTVTQTANGCEGAGTAVSLTINALPSAPVVSNDTAICFGDPTPNLTASGTNINWYDGLGNFITTTNIFPPGVTAPGIYIYYATQTNTVTGCESLGDTVKLTINSATPPVAPDVAVCFGSPVPPLVAAGTNINWYDDLNNFVFSSNTFSTGQTAAGTYTYYVTQTNTVTTCSSQKDTVLLIISTQPTIAPTVSDMNACFGSTVPDMNSTSGSLINWYSDAALSNLVYSGNPFPTGLTSVGSYTFFATDSTPGCPHGPSDTSMLVINSLPATPAVNDTAVCFGSATPDLIFNGINVQWYNSSMTLVFSGDTFATGQTATGIYTYYVTQTNTTTGCTSVKDSSKLSINALPAMPLALDTMVCSASVIPNLSSTGANVQWYDTSWMLVHTGNSFSTGQTAPGIYNYLVTQKDPLTGCEGTPDTSTLSILTSPPVPVANSAAICFGNPVPALTSTGTNVKWYSDAALSNLVHTGNIFNTGNTAVGVYKYYVTDSLTGCVSVAADSATLTINSAPVKPTANNVTVCYGGSSVLAATGNNPQWYSDATLINMTGTGNNFNTGQTAVGTYIYYVTDYAAGCGNSISDTVVLSINPTPLVTANTYSVVTMQNTSTTLIAYNAIQYSWSPSAGLNSTTGSTVVASPSVTTTYTVTGTNVYGCSNSTTILVVVNPLGVSVLNDPVQDVLVYPNPAINRFTLEFNTALESPIEIDLINTLGEKINVIQDAGMQGTGLMKHKYQISTGGFAEGVYQIQIVTEQGIVNRRVVLLK